MPVEGAELRFTPEMVRCMNESEERRSLLPPEPPTPYTYKGEVPLGNGEGLRASYRGGAPVCELSWMTTPQNFSPILARQLYPSE